MQVRGRFAARRRRLLALLVPTVVLGGQVATLSPVEAALPAPVLVSGPTSPGRERPVWEFRTATGSTRCSAVPAGTAPAFRDCASPWSPVLGSDGAYRVDVVAVGRTGTSSSLRATYVLDTRTGVRLTPPRSPSSQRAPRWEISLEDGASAVCGWDGGAPAPCGATAAPSLGAAPDGDHVLRVTATDRAGNTSTVRSRPYRLDTTAPAAPRPVLVGATGTTSTWTWVQEPGATATCTVLDDGAPTGAAASCTSGRPVRVPTSTASVEVVVTDEAGNASRPGRAAPPSSPPATGAAAPAVGPVPPAAPGAAPEVPGARAPGAAAPDPEASGTATSDPVDGGDVDTGPALPAAGIPGALLPAQVPSSGPAVPGTTGTADGLPTSPRQSCSSPVLLRRSGARFTCNTPTPLASLRAAGRATAAAVSAPVLRIDPGPTPTADRTPDVRVVGEAGTASCRVAGLFDWRPCASSPEGSALALDLTGHPDGVHVVQVRGTDGTGAEAYAEAAWELDTTAPAAPVVTGASGPSSRRTAVWQLEEVEPGAALECLLTVPGGTPRPLACAVPEVRTGSLELDGTWALTAVVVDTAGNRSASVSRTYVLDTQAPVLEDLVPGQAAVGRVRQASWSWDLSAGARAQCTVLLDGQAVDLRLPPCSSPLVLTLPQSAPDGLYALQVTPVDEAGNVGTVREGSYLLDTSAPAAPSFTSSPSSPSSSARPSWGLATPPGSSARCAVLLRGRPVAPATACTSPHVVDLRALDRGEGSYVLRVWAVDDAGNASVRVDSAPYAYRSDAARPVVWTGGPEGAVPALTSDWTFRSEPGARFTCRLTLDGSPLGARRACDGRYQVAGLDRAGTYVLSVWVEVDGSRSSTPATRTAELDLTDPAAPRLTGTPANPGRTPSVRWSWEAEAGTVASCRLAQVGSWQDCSGAGGSWSTTLPGEGTWNAQVRVRDAAGRTSPVTTAPDHTYDVTGPDPGALTVTPSTGTAGTTSRAVWGWRQAAGTTATCSTALDGLQLGRAQACRSSFVLPLDGAAAGTYVLTLVLRDAQDNPTRVTSAFVLRPPTVLPDAAPAPAPDEPRPPVPGTAGRGVPARAPLPVAAAPVRPPRVPELPVRDQRLLDVPGTQQRPVRLVAQERAVPALVPGLPAALDSALRRALEDTLTRPAVPLALLALVLGFLLVQDRIDRRDPKLAAAPLEPEPDPEFGPAVARPEGTT